MKTKILLFGAFVALSFFSCNSNDATPSATNITANDVAMTSKADATLNDVSAIAEDQFSAQQGFTSKSSGARLSILPSCATVTTVLTKNTWTKTVDFGTVGCTMPNGNSVKGKVIISFINDFTAASHSISYTFQDFYHNGRLIEGSKSFTVTNTTTPLLNEVHPVATSDNNISITFEDGLTYSITGTRIREMVAGNKTPLDWKDDVYLITGNSTITRKNGDVITTTITTPLRFEMSCNSPFPVSGTKTVTKKEVTATIDFGTGTCDALANKTINNVTTEITLTK